MRTGTRMDRRQVIGWSLASGAAAVLSRVSAAAVVWRAGGGTPMLYDWKPTRVPHVLVAAGEGGNMVLVLGRDGKAAMLVDTQACPYARQIRREAEHLGGKVELVISTHHHAEITGGNRAFTPDTRVIGHARNAARISGQMNRYVSQVKEFLFRKEDPARKEAWEAVRADFAELNKHKAAFMPEEFAPNETVDAERTELEVGGRRVVLMSLGAAHTDNDLGVHLPDDDVLITGGVVSHGMHVVVDRDSGADTRGWCAALRRLESMCSPTTVVVPGEGEVGGSGVLGAQRTYLEALRASVEEGVAKGLSRAEVRALKPAVAVGDSKGARLAMSLDAVYDEVRAEGAGEVREKK